MSTTFAECPSCHAINKANPEKADMAVCGKCQTQLKIPSEVTAAGMRKILKHAPSVVVDFWASWCGPCKMYAPEYERAAYANPNTVFLKVNSESEQQLSAEFGIRGIPCTILFKDGREVRRQAGAMSADQVKQFIS